MKFLKTFVRHKLRDHNYRHLQRLNDVQYKEVMQHNSIPDSPCEGEAEWLSYWQRFGVKVSPRQYRVFHHYIGSNPHFVPEEVCNCFIEPVLCPEELRGPYLDKNFFDRLLPQGFLPPTVCRRMDGHFYDSEYRHLVLDDSQLRSLLDGHSAVIVKPSYNSTQGDGIELFQPSDNGHWFASSDHNPLTVSLLINRWKGDFIMQQAVRQSSFTAQFNPSSVNTVRLAVYRSVADDRCHLLGSILRIGGDGSLVDNVHMGGRFVGIKPDGSLDDTLFTQHAEPSPLLQAYPHLQSLHIPEWEAIVAFGKDVCSRLPHHRLLALDIALDSNDKPCLLEFNIQFFSTWFFQYTSGSAFGDYADEIVEYCLHNNPTRILRY